MFGENMYFSYNNNIMCRSVISDINHSLLQSNTYKLNLIPEYKPVCNAFNIFSIVNIFKLKKQ